MHGAVGGKHTLFTAKAALWMNEWSWSAFEGGGILKNMRAHIEDNMLKGVVYIQHKVVVVLTLILRSQTRYNILRVHTAMKVITSWVFSPVTVTVSTRARLVPPATITSSWVLSPSPVTSARLLPTTATATTRVMVPSEVHPFGGWDQTLR